MKQINPLQLVIFLTLLLGISLYMLHNKKAEVTTIKNKIAHVNAVADEIVNLKKSWGNKKINKTKAMRILNHSIIKNGDIKYKVSRSTIAIEGKNIDLKTLNYLLNKILNATLNVTALKIRHLDEHHADITMEIRL